MDCRGDHRISRPAQHLRKRIQPEAGFDIPDIEISISMETTDIYIFLGKVILLCLKTIWDELKKRDLEERLKKLENER